MSGLETILNKKSCFKLVCGAGNEDPVEVEKLVAVYAKAGANYFDLSAREEIVMAAKKGLSRVISVNRQNEYFLNISVGIAGDPHVRKAFINLEKCNECGTCQSECAQLAITTNQAGQYTIIQQKCIGCGACAKVCPSEAIEYITENKDLLEVIPPLVKLGMHSIELHAVTDDEEGAYRQWQILNSCFNGILSLCIDRSHLGDKLLIARIKRFIKDRGEYSTIIQADGTPMSGSDDRPNTTLQALGTADIVQKARLPVWILISGGTNSRTTELARIFEIDIHGVAIGSYARKIVKNYITQEDFLENEEAFNAAYLIAKGLIDKSLSYLEQ